MASKGVELIHCIDWFIICLDFTVLQDYLTRVNRQMGGEVK